MVFFPAGNTTAGRFIPLLAARSGAPERTGPGDRPEGGSRSVAAGGADMKVR